MKKKSKASDWAEIEIHLLDKQISFNCINYESPFDRLSRENLQKELKSAEEREAYETCQRIKQIIDAKMNKSHSD